MTKILPKEFIQQTQKLMGKEMFAQLADAICHSDPPTSIRLNRFKMPRGTHLADNKDTENMLKPQGADEKNKPQTENTSHRRKKQAATYIVPWCPDYGRYLTERPNFTFDPLFHAGLYYTQEASSMFVDLVAKQLIHEPVIMLDLCAAPGGKSTAMRNALPDGSLLVSNEPMRARAQILTENMQKFGHPDVIVTNNYPKDFQKAGILFDIILADVPCSGEGMFRKDDGAISEWSTDNVRNCSSLQRSIIEDIWPCLKPGGLLIYSTCTFNETEDELNASHIIYMKGAEPVELEVDEAWGITGNLCHPKFPVYRFLPGKTRGEGLFIAVMRKNEDAETLDIKSDKYNRNRKKMKHKDMVNTPTTKIPQGWLAHPESYQGARIGDHLYAIPKAWRGIYATMVSNLKVLHAGIEIGTIMSNGTIIPAQSLALSTEVSRHAFPRAELNYADALRYLRKETVNLPESTPRGYVLVTYHGIPLGWVKNIIKRANNLYPQEWRIKSSHVPQTDKPVITW